MGKPSFPMPTPTLVASLTQHLRQIRHQLAPLDLAALARQSGFLRRTPRKIPMLDLVLALLALAVECCLSLEPVAAVIGLAAQSDSADLPATLAHRDDLQSLEKPPRLGRTQLSDGPFAPPLFDDQAPVLCVGVPGL